MLQDLEYQFGNWLLGRWWKLAEACAVECEVTKSNAQLEKDQWSLRASTRLAMEIGGPSVEESSNETHALCCGHSPSSKWVPDQSLPFWSLCWPYFVECCIQIMCIRHRQAWVSWLISSKTTVTSSIKWNNNSTNVSVIERIKWDNVKALCTLPGM